MKKNVSEIMFTWGLTYDAVYTSFLRREGIGTITKLFCAKLPGEVRIPSLRGSIPELSMRKVGIGTK